MRDLKPVTGCEQWESCLSALPAAACSKGGISVPLNHLWRQTMSLPIFVLLVTYVHGRDELTQVLLWSSACVTHWQVLETSILVGARWPELSV